MSSLLYNSVNTDSKEECIYDFLWLVIIKLALEPFAIATGVLSEALQFIGEAG